MLHGDGLGWGEVFALISVIATIAGVYARIVRRTKTDLNASLDGVKGTIADLETNHLVPIKNHLAAMNGRIGKMEQRLDDHTKSDEVLLAQVHGRIDGMSNHLDKDVREIRDFMRQMVRHSPPPNLGS